MFQLLLGGLWQMLTSKRFWNWNGALSSSCKYFLKSYPSFHTLGRHFHPYLLQLSSRTHIWWRHLYKLHTVVFMHFVVCIQFSEKCLRWERDYAPSSNKKYSICTELLRPEMDNTARSSMLIVLHILAEHTLFRYWGRIMVLA